MTQLADQIRKAQAFRALHKSGKLLLLPNAWDAISARFFEMAGFPAIATTSGGVAWALGYQDGEHAPWAEVVAATRRIARVVQVPVSADIEMGYADTPEQLASNIAEMIAAGAVGINIEDGTPRTAEKIRPVALAAERVRAARRAADKVGVPIVINARTDVFHIPGGEPQTKLRDAVERAGAYMDAGADCIFVFGHLEMDVAAELARTIKAPINIVGRPGMPDARHLERLGIARVSTASGPSMAVMEVTSTIARSLFETGSFDVFKSSLKRPDVQAMFASRSK